MPRSTSRTQTSAQWRRRWAAEPRPKADSVPPLELTAAGADRWRLPDMRRPSVALKGCRLAAAKLLVDPLRNVSPFRAALNKSSPVAIPLRLDSVQCLQGRWEITI